MSLPLGKYHNPDLSVQLYRLGTQVGYVVSIVKAWRHRLPTTVVHGFFPIRIVGATSLSDKEEKSPRPLFYHARTSVPPYLHSIFLFTRRRKKNQLAIREIVVYGGDHDVRVCVCVCAKSLYCFNAIRFFF